MWRNGWVSLAMLRYLRYPVISFATTVNCATSAFATEALLQLTRPGLSTAGVVQLHPAVESGVGRPPHEAAQAHEAVDAGATFLVSPGTDEAVVAAMRVRTVI